MAFIEQHWRDLMGALFVLLGTLMIVFNVWKLGSNAQVYGVGVGLMNAGFLAMSIERPPSGGAQ